MSWWYSVRVGMIANGNYWICVCIVMVVLVVVLVGIVVAVV